MPDRGIHQARPDGEGRIFMVFLLLALALSLDLLVLGPYALYRQHDLFDWVFSEVGKAHGFLRYSGISWWTTGGGLPAYASHHPPYSAPFLLAALGVPLWLLYGLIQVANLTAAGYGMHLLLRRFHQASPTGAFIGALFFVLSLHIYEFFSIHVALLPFVILCCDRMLKQGGSVGAALAWALGAVLFALFNMNPVMTTLVFAPMHLLYILLCVDGGSRRRNLAGAFVFWGVFGLVFLPWAYVLAGYKSQTTRELALPAGHYGVAGFLASLRGLFIQDDMPLILLLPALAPVALRRGGPVRCLAFAAHPALAILLMQSPLALALRGTPLEFIVYFKSMMFLPSLHFCVCLFAAVAVDRLIRQGQAAPLAWSGGLLALALSVYGKADYALRLVLLFLFVLALVECFRPGLGRRRLMAGLCLAALTALVFTGVTFPKSVSSFVPYVRGFGPRPALERLSREAGQEPFRVASLNLDASVVTSHGLDDLAGGRGIFFNARYRELVQQIPQGALASETERQAYAQEGYRLDLFAVAAGNTRRRNLAFNADRTFAATDWNLNLLRAMNTRYLVSATPLAGQTDGVRLVAAPAPPFDRPITTPRSIREFYSLPLWVYSLDGALPRGYLAFGQRVEQTPADVAADMSRASMDELGRTAYLLRSDFAEAGGLPAANENGQGSARLVEAVPDQLTFQVRTDGPCLLIVTDNFHSGWQAQVGGRPVPVVHANLAFMGVPIEGAGEHLVRLTHQDPKLWTLQRLCVLAALALLAVPALAAAFRRNPSRPQAPEDFAAKAQAEATTAWPAPAWPLTPRQSALVGLGTICLMELALLLIEGKASRMYSYDKPVFYLLFAAPLISGAFLVWLRHALRTLALDKSGTP